MAAEVGGKGRDDADLHTGNLVMGQCAGAVAVAEEGRDETLSQGPGMEGSAEGVAAGAGKDGASHKRLGKSLQLQMPT